MSFVAAFLKSDSDRLYFIPEGHQEMISTYWSKWTKNASRSTDSIKKEFKAKKKEIDDQLQESSHAQDRAWQAAVKQVLFDLIKHMKRVKTFTLLIGYAHSFYEARKIDFAHCLAQANESLKVTNGGETVPTGNFGLPESYVGFAETDGALPYRKYVQRWVSDVSETYKVLFTADFKAQADAVEDLYQEMQRMEARIDFFDKAQRYFVAFVFRRDYQLLNLGAHPSLLALGKKNEILAACDALCGRANPSVDNDKYPYAAYYDKQLGLTCCDILLESPDDLKLSVAAEMGPD